MFPSEFLSAFDAQYPKQKLEYTLPTSLDKCPSLKALIENNIETHHELILVIMDKNNVKYDMLTRTYSTLDNPHMVHTMSNQGYELMFEELYKRHAGNLSPKSFAFILDDLVELNPVKFRANLVCSQTEYMVRKAIELNKAWIDYCSKYKTKFKMDYNEYEKLVGIAQKESE